MAHRKLHILTVSNRMVLRYVYPLGEAPTIVRVTAAVRCRPPAPPRAHVFSPFQAITGLLSVFRDLLALSRILYK